jgi:hypothetical protein
LRFVVAVPRRRGRPFVFLSRNYYYPSVRPKVNRGDVQRWKVKHPWNTASWNPASVLVTVLLVSVSIGLILYVPISYTTTYETSVGISSVTSLQVANYSYITSYWTSEITPYAYFGSSENQSPIMVAIIALSIVAALSLLLISNHGVHKAHYLRLSRSCLSHQGFID